MGLENSQQTLRIVKMPRESRRHESDRRRRRSKSRSRSPETRSKRRDDHESPSPRKSRHSREDSKERRRHERDSSPAKEGPRRIREQSPSRKDSSSRTKLDKSPVEKSPSPEGKKGTSKEGRTRKRHDSSPGEKSPSPEPEKRTSKERRSRKRHDSSPEEPRRRHDSSKDDRPSRSRKESSSSPERSPDVKDEPRSSSLAESEAESSDGVEEKPVVDALSFSPVPLPEEDEPPPKKKKSPSPDHRRRERRSSHDRREHRSSRRHEKSPRREKDVERDESRRSRRSRSPNDEPRSKKLRDDKRKEEKAAKESRRGRPASREGYTPPPRTEADIKVYDDVEYDGETKSDSEDERIAQRRMQSQVTIPDKLPPTEPRKRKQEDILTTKTGGAYIPPAKLRMMQDQITDKSSLAYQRLAWEALKKSINGLVNKVNVGNLGVIVRELIQENLVRGRGLFCKAVVQAQLASPTFTHVYAALMAVVNTKFPNIGELLLKRLIIQFRRGYKSNNKQVRVHSS